MSRKKLFAGIDVGTQGVRMLWVDESGVILYTGSRSFISTDEIRIRQDPEEWWRLLDEIFLEANSTLPASFFNEYVMKTIGVTSTSGTVIPMGKNDKVLYGAIMYSDPRSQEYGEKASEWAKKYYGDRPGLKKFNSSCGLSKILWYLDQMDRSEKEEVVRFVHASDYVTGRMTGIYHVTDHSNALKSGYDLEQDGWPDDLFSELGIPSRFLPEVRAMGSILGPLKEEYVQRWKLPEAPQVTVGLTDGCASQFSAGAVSPGEWNTTIGTTLVLKGVSEIFVNDAEGSIYCHRHPEGYWMPGGASNIGADWVNEFSAEEIRRGSDHSHDLRPASVFYYPLLMKGERFPFISHEAEGFVWGNPADRDELFQAGLEGVAFIERYAYERIEALSGSRVEKVFSAGGGNNNKKWLNIRANVLDKPVLVSEKSGGAMGAAMVGAAGELKGGLKGTVQHLLGSMEVFKPAPQLVKEYEGRYQEFIRILKRKGFLND